METASKYTKTFDSNGLTRQKYDELHELAVSINEQKNKVSELVRSDLLKFLEASPLGFVTDMRSMFKGEVSSNFDKHLYEQVIIAYQNKFEAVQKKLKFEHVTFCGFEYYKRDTKNNKRGDLKKVVSKRTTTPLSSCLSYLARYGNPDTVAYIQQQLASCDSKKAEFYENILRCCDKFGFERLYALALRKRERVLKHYNRKPIEFKSLTFSGRSRKKRVVDYNKHYGSVVNAFISLSVPTRKSLDIPVKYCKDYHGDMHEYAKKSADYEYTLCFDEKHKQVKVNLVKDGMRSIPTVTDADTAVGIDVNVKHNLFALSDGTSYDYDRALVEDYCKLKRRLDALKEGSKEYKVGRRKQYKLDALRNKMLKSNQQLIAGMCKSLQQQGIRHAVMEDLNNGFGKSYVKDERLDGINFNDIVKFLGISSLKGEVEHIGRKYGVAVSTVHASYTSKMCPVCGCIADENRPSQEEFECIECGHCGNADTNAAINIRNRVSEAVLRVMLLKQLDNGAYAPRKLKRERVKEVLLSFRSSKQQCL